MFICYRTMFQQFSINVCYCHLFPYLLHFLQYLILFTFLPQHKQILSNSFLWYIQNYETIPYRDPKYQTERSPRICFDFIHSFSLYYRIYLPFIIQNFHPIIIKYNLNFYNNKSSIYNLNCVIKKKLKNYICFHLFHFLHKNNKLIWLFFKNLYNYFYLFKHFFKLVVFSFYKKLFSIKKSKTYFMYFIIKFIYIFLKSTNL